MKAAGLTHYVAMGGLPIVIDEQRMTAFFADMNKDHSLVNLLGGNKYEFADWASQKGLAIMETFLQKYPKIDAVFCQIVYKMIMDNDPLVRTSVTYHPSMIGDGIRYAVDGANGVKSADFHKAKSPVTVVIPSVLVDKTNVAKHYQPDSIY